MGYYQFALDKGDESDDLGAMALPDDDAAIAFGKQVIRDLKGDADQYARWSMGIMQGERSVGTIPFELGAPQSKGGAIR